MAKRPSSHARSGPSQRQLRVGEAIRHCLSAILLRGDFHEPLLARGMISVTEVRVSPDLKRATAYVMPLTGSNMERIVTALNAARKSFRHVLALELDLKHTRHIEVVPDHSFDAAATIDRALRAPDVQRDLSKNLDETSDDEAQ